MSLPHAMPVIYHFFIHISSKVKEISEVWKLDFQFTKQIIEAFRFCVLTGMNACDIQLRACMLCKMVLAGMTESKYFLKNLSAPDERGERKESKNWKILVIYYSIMEDRAI